MGRDQRLDHLNVSIVGFLLRDEVPSLLLT